MKRIALFLLCCCSIVASAQQYISQSHRGSAQNRIYKISDKEALEIFRRIQAEKRWANEKYLHTFAGAYPVEKPLPVATTAGNYVVATARRNDIWYEFSPVHNVTLKIVSNNYDLALLIHDQQGNLLPGARVQINRKNIPWDARTKTYRLPRYTRSGIVQVYYNGALNIFEVNSRPNNRQYPGGKNYSAVIHSTGQHTAFRVPPLRRKSTKDLWLLVNLNINPEIPSG